MLRTALASVALFALLPAARAQDAAPGAEPRVQRTVIDDGGTRIEELRVRGQLQRVVVTPKGGARAYEILPGDSSRDLSEGHGSTRGAAGKRVWHVLSF